MKIDKATAMGFLKNTFVKYNLINGDEVKLTLAFALLKELEKRHPDLATRYFKIQGKKDAEIREYDMVTILYTAYVCANFDDPDMMPEEIFAILLGSDRFSLRGVFNQLMGAKKNPAFVKHS